MNFLEEIRKNAGETQNEVNEKISTKSNNLKQKIVQNTGIDYVVEMAQQHFDDEILDLILKGEYSEAADKYISNQIITGYRVPPKADATVNKLISGAFAKGFKASQEKVGQITKQDWDKFKRAYENIIKTETKPRERKRTKGEVDVSGQVRTSVSPTVNAKKLRDKVMKLRDEVLSELKLTSDPVKKEDLESHVDGLNTLLSALEYTIAGRATLPPKTPEQLEKLKQRYIKIGKEFQGIKGTPASAEDDDDYDPPSSIRPEIRDQAIRGLEQAKAQGWNTLESLNLKGKILAESLEYKGQNFWSNYTMSMITKAFAKDLKLFKEETKYIYAKVFGASSIPIFEYMEENSQALNEVVQSKSNFLFETYSFDVLSEVTPASRQIQQSARIGMSQRKASAIPARTDIDHRGQFTTVPGYVPPGAEKITSREAARAAARAANDGVETSSKLAREAERAAAAREAARIESFGNFTANTATGTAASAGGEVAKAGFLAGLWDKIKQFGSAIVGRLTGLISSGVAWAKNIAEQGMGWIAANPVAQVAIPAIVLAGSAVGAVKLINRMRRKKGERKLSRQEQQQIKRISTEKSKEIEKQTEKMKARPTARRPEPKDDIDDEEDLVSDKER